MPLACRRLRAALDGYGVGTQLVREVEGPSGTAVILLEEDGAPCCCCACLLLVFPCDAFTCIQTARLLLPGARGGGGHLAGGGWCALLLPMRCLHTCVGSAWHGQDDPELAMAWHGMAWHGMAWQRTNMPQHAMAHRLALLAWLACLAWVKSITWHSTHSHAPLVLIIPRLP